MSGVSESKTGELAKTREHALPQIGDGHRKDTLLKTPSGHVLVATDDFKRYPGGKNAIAKVCRKVKEDGDTLILEPTQMCLRIAGRHANTRDMLDSMLRQLTLQNAHRDKVLQGLIFGRDIEVFVRKGGVSHPRHVRKIQRDKTYSLMPHFGIDAQRFLSASQSRTLTSKLHDIISITLELFMIHAHDVVHCDARCENIMKDANGRFRIVDFEYAVKVGAKVEGGASDLASSMGKKASTNIDLYLLVIQIYRIITLRNYNGSFKAISNSIIHNLCWRLKNQFDKSTVTFTTKAVLLELIELYDSMSSKKLAWLKAHLETLETAVRLKRNFESAAPSDISSQYIAHVYAFYNAMQDKLCGLEDANESLIHAELEINRYLSTHDPAILHTDTRLIHDFLRTEIARLEGLGIPVIYERGRPTADALRPLLSRKPTSRDDLHALCREALRACERHEKRILTLSSTTTCLRNITRFFQSSPA